MSTSVRTKIAKTHKVASIPDLSAQDERALENALLSLDNACIVLLENPFAGSKQDLDGREWQQRFANIATPISLALMEHKGPRHFHYHYKHRADDDAVLHPVLDDPLATLAHACKDTLARCHNDLAGLQDRAMLEQRDMLETALKAFLHCYQTLKK